MIKFCYEFNEFQTTMLIGIVAAVVAFAMIAALLAYLND